MFVKTYTADPEGCSSATKSQLSSPTLPSQLPNLTLSSGTPSPIPCSPRQGGDYSTSGAFKGTGLAAVSSSSLRDRYLFFQHYTGQIRQLVSKDKNAWAGGSNSDVVIGSNARNGTPLTVGGYTKDQIRWV